jgi:hypothetical protein
MSFKSSYFELPNPLELLQRFLNPGVHSGEITLNGKPLSVSWTRRAGKQLERRDHPLLVEMQIYFSCVVKKRVLFHEEGHREGVQSVMLGDRLRIAFRAVQATSCDPVEFAANYPEHHEFESAGATKMHARALRIDYRDGQWQGEFDI